MSNLSLFMKKNKEVRENAKFPATRSLKDDKGNPLEWEIKPLTTKQNERMRNDSTVEIPIDKKRTQFRQKLDISKYGQSLIVASVVFPDLNNAELQDSYGVNNPEDLVMEMIDNPGEFAEFQAFITEYNGFDSSLSDEVEEAKN